MNGKNKRQIMNKYNKIFSRIFVLSVFFIFLLSAINVLGSIGPSLTRETNFTNSALSLISQNQVTGILTNVEPQQINSVSLSENQNYYQIKSSQYLITNTGNVSVDISTDIDAFTGSILNSEKIIKINGKKIQENANEFFIIQDNKVKKITNIVYPNKNLLREKACRFNLIPMISTEKIQRPILRNIFSFAVQVRKNHDLDFDRYLLPSSTSEEYDFILVKTKELRTLLEHPLVIKICDAENLQLFTDHVKEFFNQESKEMIKKSKLKNTIFDVEPDLTSYLNEDNWSVQPSQNSIYQQFVTPNDEAIVELASSINSPEEAYELACYWVWVSDNTLNGKVEKWLKPNEFLTETPLYSNNPVKGSIASDCSEQANTLVTLLRAIGVSAEDVRVVIGEVKFEDEIGGHAWVEIWTGNGWMPLDPTSGRYYDDNAKTLVSRNEAPYSYWMYHPYPVVEVWAYYNDQYYSDKGEEIISKWSQDYQYESFIEATISVGFLALESFDIVVVFILILGLATVVIITVKKGKKQKK